MKFIFFNDLMINAEKISYIISKASVIVVYYENSSYTEIFFDKCEDQECAFKDIKNQLSELNK